VRYDSVSFVGVRGLHTTTAMLKSTPLLALGALLAQQPGMPGRDSRTGLIVGQVIDAGTGRPVGGALVEISAQPFLETDRPRNVEGFPAILTASDGRFVIRHLPAARYTMTAVKAGYLEGSYGRRRPEGSGQTLLLADGQKAGTIRVYLFRNAAITGLVLDEAGEPVIGIQVRALRRLLVGIQRRFVYTGAVGWTDDRGIYRIAGLPPGDYMVAATATQVSVPASAMQDMRQSGPASGVAEIGASAVRGPTTMQVGDSILMLGRSAIGPAPSSEARLFVYPTTFHPDTASPVKATVFTVASGEERGGIDLRLLPVPTRRVSGVVVGLDNQVGGVAVRIVPEDADDSPIDLEVASTVTSRDGRFSFPAVPVGNYLVRAVTGVPILGAPLSTTTIHTAFGVTVSSVETMAPRNLGTYGFPNARWASVPLAVGRDDVTAFSVRLQPGLQLAGRVEFDGSNPKPAGARLLQIPVNVTAATPAAQLPAAPGRIDPSGRLSIYGLPGGRYLLQIGAPPAGWQLKSATYNGRDISESAFELDAGDMTGVIVLFTDRPTQIAGSVRTSAGAPDADATVVVFPTDPQTWAAWILNPRRFQSARVSPAGAYTIGPLPPGDYFVVAIPEEQSPDWQDPRQIDALSRVASTVAIAEGEKRTQDLRTKEIR